MASTKAKKRPTSAKQRAKPKARSVAKPRAVTKASKRKKQPAPPRSPKAEAESATPRPVIDLSAALQIRNESGVPVLARTAGRPVVAWARIGAVAGRQGAAKSWVAQLTAGSGRVNRAFVERATSKKIASTVVCDDPFILETTFAQMHPLAAGVYEASSTWTGGPPGYEGRASFDVAPDGAIAIVGVGPRDRSFTPEVERELVERIAAHDARDRGATSTRMERERAEREGAASVENDRLIQTYNLPDLEGTPKQVSWAMAIRKRTFEELFRNSNNAGMWVDVIRAQTSASWWIDRRNNAASEIVRLRVSQLTARS